MNSIHKNARQVCITSIKIWARVEKEVLSLYNNPKELFLWEVSDIFISELNLSYLDWDNNKRNYVINTLYTLKDLIKNPGNKNEFNISVPLYFNKDLIMFLLDNKDKVIF